MSQASTQNTSAFKRAQTRFKSSPIPSRLATTDDCKRPSDATPSQTSKRKPTDADQADDWDDLIDFSDITGSEEHTIRRLALDDLSGDAATEGFYHGPLYGIDGVPGFVYAPQALSLELQHRLAWQSLKAYCEKPHATNMDATFPGGACGMWKMWKEENGHGSNTNKGTKTTKQTFRKLSWATPGYHYDWTARTYHRNAFSPMPEELSTLGRIFARTALRLQHPNDSAAWTFKSTAGIVNYYHGKSVMGGHRDDLELALEKPIVSMSMGRPAVFLLGGLTKEESPVLPILIRPGDVLMMGGDARLRYHGMARLLPVGSSLRTASASNEPVEQDEFLEICGLPQIDDQGERKAIGSFLNQHRININLRQVYTHDCDP